MTHWSDAADSWISDDGIVIDNTGSLDEKLDYELRADAAAMAVESSHDAEADELAEAYDTLARYVSMAVEFKKALLEIKETCLEHEHRAVAFKYIRLIADNALKRAGVQA
jgi:hypothetical protein